MPRLKSRARIADDLGEAYVPNPKAVTLVGPQDELISRASPALALQAHLEESWEVMPGDDIVHVKKIPFALTLAGMSILCAAFWYGVSALIF